ncbi:MAG: PP2C family protein-serine/threonine phosphatase [Anaerolineae bacterium]
MNRSSSPRSAVTVGAATRAGAGRNANEDSLWAPEAISHSLLVRKGYLYIVADGIGGHRNGELASRAAVKIMHTTYYDDQCSDVAASLQRAVQAANAGIFRQSQDPGFERLGATVVAGVVRSNELVIASVGDSRAYLLRKGKLKRLTRDHTWVAERVAAGILTAKEAAHHDMRHVVTRSLGGKPAVQVDVRQYRLRSGDRLLLCSDGIWEPLSERQIVNTLTGTPPQMAAAALIEHAVEGGGSDDATALVVAPELARARVLDRLGGAANSPRSSLVRQGAMIGLGLVLVLALFTCGIMQLFRGCTARPDGTRMDALPLVQRPLMSDNTEGQMAEAPQWPTPSSTKPLTATLTPFHSIATAEVESLERPTQQPTWMREAGQYCVVSSTSDDVGPDFPANAVDPDTCQETGTAIPVGERVWIAHDALSQDCEGNVLIEVTYEARRYWVLANRIWRQSATGECQPIERWREFFATPRQP